ncbi:MAG: hypothetical protein DMG57_26060 [Acidobacteria bacterium]|nr:MAG: hypothetical protein DMG57_26060 [Acidobacteriota bacterium]
MRRKEIATRLAIGAGRAQLLRQLVVENVLIGSAGGIADALLGAAILRTLTVISLDRFPRASEVHIDGAVVLAALGISVVVGVLMGFLPLASVLRVSLSSVLHDDSRTGTGGLRTRRLRQARSRCSFRSWESMVFFRILVTLHRREIGIRIALGSTGAGVVKLVLRQGLALLAVGLAVGFTGAVHVTKSCHKSNLFRSAS